MIASNRKGWQPKPDSGFPVVTHNGSTYDSSNFTSNTLHIFGTLTVLNIATPTAISSNGNLWIVQFTAGATVTLAVPSGTKWENNSAPTFTSGRTYEITLLNGLLSCREYYL